MKRKFDNKTSGEPKPFSGHEFKKSLGQNFLRDVNLLKSIVRDAEVTKTDAVVEVGAGAGTLTREIAEVAKCVISYEVDNSLKETLVNLEKEYQNLKINFEDALKADNDKIFNELAEFAGENLKTYKVVANIPYYITTPLIFKFLKDDRVTSITVMVQKEVAERIVSNIKDSEYGGISVLVNYYGVPEIKRIVKRDMFYPSPKVDSAILHIQKHNSRDKQIGEVLERVVKVAFQARRKMLVNNLSTGFNIEKSVAGEILNSINLSQTVRAEELKTEDFLNLSYKLDKKLQN